MECGAFHARDRFAPLTVTQRKAIEDIDDIYDAELEQELLLQIVEPRYVNMLKAIHHLVQTTFPDMEHFRLDDAATRSMLDHAAEQVVRIDETTLDMLRELLKIGQQRGYSNWEIANGVPRDEFPGIEGLFQETWKNRANTVARNELLEAQHNASLDRYQATGLVDRVRIRDGTSSAPDEQCLARNGAVVPLSSRPERLHVNCLPGDQLVAAPDWRFSTSRWFEGEVVIIHTADDDLLTCTPNHPVLTPRGWVAAETVRKGDDVVRCGDGERLVRSIDPDAEYRPTEIEKIARPLLPYDATATLPVSPKDFHGDGSNGDICVIRANRFLRDELTTFQQANEYQFGLALMGQRALAAKRSTIAGYIGISGAADSAVSIGRDRRSVLGSRVGVAQLTGFLTGAHGPAATFPRGAKVSVVDANRASDGWDRFTGDVSLVQVAEVRSVSRRHFSGHVYNLVTDGGWYIAGGIITHNCSVVVIPILRGE